MGTLQPKDARGPETESQHLAAVGDATAAYTLRAHEIGPESVQQLVKPCFRVSGEKRAQVSQGAGVRHLTYFLKGM